MVDVKVGDKVRLVKVPNVLVSNMDEGTYRVDLNSGVVVEVDTYLSELVNFSGLDYYISMDIVIFGKKQEMTLWLCRTEFEVI